MNSIQDHYQSYSWHQSHDQATVLLLVPYDTAEGDVSVVIERNYLVAGVRGQPPIVKGRLYGNVDTASSLWQLEPRASRHLSARERTTSTTSSGSGSTPSSYAVLSEPEISSSFAASLEHGLLSDADEPSASSPALSSPVASSVDELGGYLMPGPPHTRHPRQTSPHPTSPPAFAGSLASSYSSVESLHAVSGRLLTIHLEKAEPVIWPSLVVGPVPETLSPSASTIYPWASSSTLTVESTYNMDPTSLVLVALDLYDIREAHQDAFEYFVRAWHQAHVPSATIRLATHYLPVHSVAPISIPGISPTPSPPSPESNLEPTTPTPPHTIPQCALTASAPVLTPPPPPAPAPGTPEYYLDRIGAAQGLAELYLAAGLLHLEGAAQPLLSSAYAGLSSLRSPLTVSGTAGHGYGYSSAAGMGGPEAWRRDRENARRYFERVHTLVPSLDVPLLPPESESDPGSGAEGGERRSASSSSSGRRAVHKDGETSARSQPVSETRERAEPEPSMRRRRKKLSGDLSSEIMDNYKTGGDADEDDRTWYLYIPGLVGAGTALLIVGFLSFSSWRKSQGSS